MSPIPAMLYKLKLFLKNFLFEQECQIEDAYLEVYEAPNPIEIKWENLGYNFRKKVIVRICGSFY